MTPPTIEFIHLCFAFLVGLISGLIFFGGLWLTVERLTAWKHPALWLPLSFFTRTAIVLAAFYWIGNGSLPRIGACLIGFLMGRTIIFYYPTKKRCDKQRKGDEK